MEIDQARLGLPVKASHEPLIERHIRRGRRTNHCPKCQPGKFQLGKIRGAKITAYRSSLSRAQSSRRGRCLRPVRPVRSQSAEMNRSYGHLYYLKDS